ncbi:MAG: hypothetical protein JST04_03795 [Bdellovibrionales bacterium]|nr:hypothetical protein [Bdellovibrionales bacterium]
MGTTKKGFLSSAPFALTSVIAFGMSAHSALAASGGATFFSTAPETTPVHNAVQLNQLFQKGIGPYSSSMDGKLYPYPLPRNGQFGAPLYNGCYDRKGQRLGDLDSNLSCAGIINNNPGRAIFRLFLGYKVSCSGSPVGGICPSAQLLMNCEYKQVQVGTGALESTSAATRYCSNESGILRNAQGSSQNNNALDGCGPGEDGSGYSPSMNVPCPKCSPGTYNPSFNPNNVACTPCTAPTPLPSGVQSIGGWTSPVGATSAADCTPTGVTCISPGYHLSGNLVSCEPDAPACTLSMEAHVDQPHAGASPPDGKIVISVTGKQGALSQFDISPASTTTVTGTDQKAFTELAQGSYAVTAKDSVCTLKNTYTLTDLAAIPSPTPSPTVSLGCLHILNVSHPTTSTSNDGKFDVHVDGSGTFTFSISPNPNGVMAQTIPAPQPMSGNFTYSGLGQGPYTVTATGTCMDTQGVTLTAPTTPYVNCACYNTCESPSVMCNMGGPTVGTPNYRYYGNGSGTLHCQTPTFYEGNGTNCQGFYYQPGTPFSNQEVFNSMYAYSYCGDSAFKISDGQLPPCPSASPSPTPPSCPNWNSGSNSWTNSFVSLCGIQCASPSQVIDPWNTCNGGMQAVSCLGMGGPNTCISGVQESCNCPAKGSAQWNAMSAENQSRCCGAGPAPSPTPSVGPAPCNIASTVATSTLHVQCSYSCASGTWNGSPYFLTTRSKNLAVGERCDSPTAISRVTATSCNGPTVTSCSSSAVSAYSGMYETCSSAYTCPSGQHKEYFWDAGAWSGYGSAVHTIYTCAHSSGANSIYASCVDDGTPLPPSLYSCSQGYNARYYSGTPYCIE